MLPQTQRRLSQLRLNRGGEKNLLHHKTQNSREAGMSRTIEVAALSALVLSNPETATLVKSVLVAHGFNVVNADDASAAMDLCKRQRFDLAVYDTEISGTLGLTANGNHAFLPRVAIGLLPATDQPISARLHFLVRKPVGTELFSRTVKAAFAPIAADRRASLRQHVSVSASECALFHRGAQRKLEGVRVVNLSLSGACLHAPEMLPQGASIEAAFTLPGTDLLLHVLGKIVWAHSSGRCGVQFAPLHSHDQQNLENWLDAVLPGSPLPV
jgi:hypothetical protein